MSGLDLTMVGTGMMKSLGEEQFGLEEETVRLQKTHRWWVLRQQLTGQLRRLADALEPKPLVVSERLVP